MTHLFSIARLLTTVTINSTYRVYVAHHGKKIYYRSSLYRKATFHRHVASFFILKCVCVCGGEGGGGLPYLKNPDKDQKREILEIMKILIRGEVREERCVAFLQLQLHCCFPYHHFHLLSLIIISIYVPQKVRGGGGTTP